jgi:anti-sigma regulatory factor (Ser/Thr protein kinase)
MIAGLSVEEMAGNIVRHGIRDVHNHMIDIRISYKNGDVTIRLRDNCRAFDPTNFSSRFHSDDPTSNIGIRTIMRMAKDVVYLNNIGMNVLLIRL